MADHQDSGMSGKLFEVGSQYEPCYTVGKGAYGSVCAAKNKANGEMVAIKKIPGTLDNALDGRRTLREVTILRQLHHENVISLKDAMTREHGGEVDLYLVYELMDTDMHQIIRSSQPLGEDHAQYFIYQVLRALKYIHSAGVLHRDLKPSNLLLNANCDLKVCDFGLARAPPEEEDMTEYVVTRWYRAPELLLNCKEYGPAIDVWSTGCILAEILRRKPLFPGKHYVEQLSLITGVTGTPNEKDMRFLTSQQAKRHLRSFPEQQRADFSSLFPSVSAQGVHLVDQMLAFNPYRRPSVDQALAHPYLSFLHDPSDEPTCSSHISFSTEPPNASPADVRSLLLSELSHLRPSLTPC